MYSLVDCNAFYCSCERLFQPGLKTAPIVVLSNNDGCAISRTDEAKALGIIMGTPGFMLKEHIRNSHLKVFSSNYTLYQDMSDRVMGTLAGLVPDVEVYSIDEAFLDLKGFGYKNLHTFGGEIRATVLQNTGIPVGVGIAPTKTLAKMANRFAKKNHKETGVYCADTPERIQAMLAQTPVEDIWGIGSQRAKLLRSKNINTAAELAAIPDAWVLQQMNVTGHRLLKELRGTPCIEWEPEPPAKQGICTARSFGKLQTDIAVIEQALADYTENCARKLRAQQSAATRIQVILKTNKHRLWDTQHDVSITMPITVATNDTAKLVKYALHGLRSIFREGIAYMKTGVTLDGLVPVESVQLGLFSNADSDRSRKMHAVYDALNSEYGRGTVRFARQGFSKPYALRMAFLSPRYTTQIDHILKVY